MADVKATTSLDSRGFQDGLNKMDRGVSTLGSRIGKIGGVIAGAFAVGKIVQAFRVIGQEADRIDKSAKKLELSFQELQAFEFTAELSGAGPESIAQAFISMERAVEEALNGQETYREALERLGITAGQAAQMTGVQLFEAIAKGADATGDFAAVIDIFGKRAAKDLRPTLEVLARDGFGGLRRALQDAGVEMDEFSIRSSAQANDAMTEMAKRAKAAGAAIKSGLIDPLIIGLNEAIKKFSLFNLPTLPPSESVNDPTDSEEQERAAAEKKLRAEKILEKEIGDLRERIDEKRMSTAEKIAKVEREILDLYVKSIEAQTEVDLLQNMKERLSLQEKLAGLQDQLANENKKTDKPFDPAAGVGVSSPISDAVAKIGGSLGGMADNRALGLAERQLQIQQKTEAHLASIDQKTPAEPGVLTA